MAPRVTKRGTRWRRPLLLLLAAGLAGAAGWELWLHHPVGAGPAGPPVSPEPFAQTWTDRPALLLGLGDSVTAGLGATPGHSYFERLIVNPPDDDPALRGVCLSAVLPNLRTDNRAVSGSTSSEHWQRQIAPLPRADPETLGIVVLTTGGNDLIHNYGRSPPREGAMYGATLAQAQPWIARFEERLEAMVAQISERFPGGCHIFLANIYDPTDGVGTAAIVGLPRWQDGAAIHRAYNDAIARVAGRHAHVRWVDLHSVMLGHGIYCRQFWRPHYDAADPHYWYYENFEDPNDRGYDAIRRAFLNEIARAAPLR